jgi:phosphoglycolate phosphatase-like HAD superfamily hydrolase
VSTPFRAAALPAFVLLVVTPFAPAQGADPLPSWTDGPARQRVVKFVAAVTDRSGKDYVPPERRVATFDNDGTLWTEKPMYVEVVFALDRVQALAGKHPEWKEKEPFKTLLEADPARVSRLSDKEIQEALIVSHAGMTVAEFDALVKDWLATTKHPRFKRPYTELVYQPMVELLAYLRANGFKTYIVSGGGVEFMRTFTEKLYGIPPEQVVGSSVKTKYELRKDGPVLVRLPEFLFSDNYGGKAEGIERHIGRRPVAACGNSDGDQQMLEWTAAGAGARLMLLVHHDDAEREYAYDRTSDVGRLDKALDEATRRDWLVVSMKNDWKVIYPFDKK